jgi:hypothetical protein
VYGVNGCLLLLLRKETYLLLKNFFFVVNAIPQYFASTYLARSLTNTCDTLTSKRMKRSRTSDEGSRNEQGAEALESLSLVDDQYLEHRLLLRMCSATEPPKPASVEETPVFMDEFALIVAINTEADFLEKRVRELAASLASRLGDDDEVFKVDFADENSTEDKLRYCTAMIPLLLERLENKQQ